MGKKTSGIGPIIEPGLFSSKTKLFDAVCACGYKGKSQYPEFYKCSGCYCEARAEYAENCGKKLRDRAIKWDLEAKQYREEAKKWWKKHPKKI